MDKSSRSIFKQTMRFFSKKGYQVLSEFSLPNKRRVDIIAINLKKEIIIIEIKSKKKDLNYDKKWKSYLNYCNYFYFACNEKITNVNFSQNIGIIQKKFNKIKIIKESKYKKLSQIKKNKLILNFALSAASKFHRLIDPEFRKSKNNSIFIYKNK